jgi:hypothetical protein
MAGRNDQALAVSIQSFAEPDDRVEKADFRGLAGAVPDQCDRADPLTRLL